MASEYLIADVDAASLGNPNLHGFAVTGSWGLTGEMRGYDRKRGVFTPLPISRSVHQNGNGAWELAARWSELDAVFEDITLASVHPTSHVRQQHLQG